jgi:hypothetical protein
MGGARGACGARGTPAARAGRGERPRRVRGAGNARGACGERGTPAARGARPRRARARCVLGVRHKAPAARARGKRWEAGYPGRLGCSASLRARGAGRAWSDAGPAPGGRGRMPPAAEGRRAGACAGGKAIRGGRPGLGTPPGAPSGPVGADVRMSPQVSEIPYVRGLAEGPRGDVPNPAFQPRVAPSPAGRAPQGRPRASPAPQGRPPPLGHPRPARPTPPARPPPSARPRRPRTRQTRRRRPSALPRPGQSS